MAFEAAGGIVTTDRGASVYMPELNETATPHVLDTGTPAVLSVGARCMEQGYSFIWMAGEAPYFLKPDGSKVRLEVRHNIPYLRPGKPQCQPMSPRNAVLVPSIPSEIRQPDEVADTGGAESSSPGGRMAAGHTAEVGGSIAADRVAEEDVARLEKHFDQYTISLEHALVHKPKLPYCRICTRKNER